MPTTKSKDPEIEIKAKWSGADKWMKWGKNSCKDCSCNHCKGHKNSTSNGGGLYFVGFIGALVYFMQAAVGFGAVVTGILKAIVWPAYIVYKLLEGFYGVVA